MNPERWKQLDSLLHGVLELPPVEREAFLRRACAGDPALESEARALLALEPRAKSFLEPPAIEVAALKLARSSRDGMDRTGRTISHYRVLEELGRGVWVWSTKQRTAV